jgi:hypothetical protein
MEPIQLVGFLVIAAGGGFALGTDPTRVLWSGLAGTLFGCVLAACCWAFAPSAYLACLLAVSAGSSISATLLGERNPLKPWFNETAG